MASRATEIRKGQVLEKDGDLFLITEYEHRTPGNLRSIIQIKIKSLSTGGVQSMRLSSADSVDVAFLDKKAAEYLYQESNGDYIFMDSENYEQFPLGKDVVGDKMGFVKPNEQVEVTWHNELAIGLALPTSVVLEVIEAEMAVKGNTATNVKKNAVLETGQPIKVPFHIKVGEQVKVSTDTGDFMGRAQE
ncbi:MAG: elongation factor P [Planctomycetota bacterium]|nr:elongation factor P [Planctomycetota bacterium]MDG2144429.1 elongation factor P [Planctomycetota bacterium]